MSLVIYNNNATKWLLLGARRNHLQEEEKEEVRLSYLTTLLPAAT
jgi:hypothetical protein